MNAGFGFGVLFFFGLQVSAQIIAPSAQEVRFSYTATVVAPVDKFVNAKELASLQARHLFGIFASAEFVTSYGIDPEKTESIGAPSTMMEIKIHSQKTAHGEKIVEYSASGRMILEKRAAAVALRRGVINVPLPVNPYAIYDTKCTDKHYPGFNDYWYFYNPFRDECSHLSQVPYSNAVSIQVAATPERRQDLTPRLDLVRGANRNGNLFSIYVVHGYSESTTNPRDDGRKGFRNFNRHMKELGFDEKIKRAGTTYPLHIYTKTMTFSGKETEVVVRHLLVDTEATTKNISFAKFFKEAVENADVIIYGGHSGLGSNLNIPNLEAKAGRFNFVQGKRQIYFFEACSSYSYYLEPFAAAKTKTTIDIVTNGLSSYFHTGDAIMRAFMGFILDETLDDVPWIDILSAMEEPLEGGSFLTNVGGI